MKALFFLMAFLLTACVPTVAPTMTPNSGDIALDMVQQQMAAEATSQVVGLQLSATAQVVWQTATHQAVGTAEVVTQQARMDEIATSDQARTDASATQARVDMIATQDRQWEFDRAATAHAMIAIRNTQSADATSTFTVMTLTAIPPHATLTQIAVDNQVVINNQNVEKSALDLQRARDTNRISWIAPLLFALVSIGAGVLWVIRKSRWNAFSDEDGKLLGFGHDDKYINPRLLTGPVLNLKDGTVTDPTPEQIKVTERAQIIEALSVMPENPSPAGAAVFNKYFGESPAKPYDVIEGNVLPPVGLLDSEALKSIEKDWKEANDG